MLARARQVVRGSAEVISQRACTMRIRADRIPTVSSSVGTVIFRRHFGQAVSQPIPQSISSCSHSLGAAIGSFHNGVAAKTRGEIRTLPLTEYPLTALKCRGGGCVRLVVSTFVRGQRTKGLSHFPCQCQHVSSQNPPASITHLPSPLTQMKQHIHLVIRDAAQVRPSLVP